MRFALFPYERVTAGARVIVYGMGFCGHQLVQQLAQNHYCEVLFAVDRACSRRECNEVEIRSVEALQERGLSYDYVVIALLDAGETGRVHKALREMGVPEGKIIGHVSVLRVHDPAYQQKNAGEAVQLLRQMKPQVDKLQSLQQSVTETDRFVRRYVWNALCDLDSYTHNEFLQKHCTGWEQSEPVAKLRSLMSLLRVRDIVQAHRFIRVGGEMDGGYVLVEGCPRGGDKILYSFGVGQDVSFEYTLAQQGYDCYMYDHTVPGLPQQHERFHYQKKGVTGREDSRHPELLTLPDMLVQNGHGEKRNMLLKMDVEGAEIDVFRNLPEDVQSRFAQIVMEIHGFTDERKWDALMLALARINRTHQLVHLHFNNYGDLLYRGDMVVAGAVEVAYVRKSDFTFRERQGCLQESEDRRCFVRRKEWFACQD